MRNFFNLDHIDYDHMSPVIIPRGYTKRFIDGEITHQEQLDKVLDSHEQVEKASDIVLLEGTGHCAVGSIVGVNNARVASLLGADMVLVANGGLGEYLHETSSLSCMQVFQEKTAGSVRCFCCGPNRIISYFLCSLKFRICI